MSSLLLSPAVSVDSPQLSGSTDESREEQVRLIVRLALAARSEGPHKPERRRQERHPFPYPVHLTPLDDDRQPVIGETIIVIGRHLSDRGFDFYHQKAIPCRRAIISIQAGDSEWIGLLLDLYWTRFNRHGWYDGGGRLLAVVPSPLSVAA